MSRLVTIVVLLALSIFLGANAFAANLITNGGFETGDFTGWTVANQAGGGGDWFVLSGTTEPISGHASVGPASGNWYASSDQPGAGCHVLYQMVTLPFTGAIQLSFDMFVNNWDSTEPFGPLDFTVSPNQYGRVDVLQPNANPFSTAAADIVQNFALSDAVAVGGPNPYIHYSFDLPSAAAGTYMLRFAEVDNQLWFNQGVDNVRVNTPEPSSLLFLLTALPFATRLRRRK